MKKLKAKLYADLYEFFWQRGDLHKCAALKSFYFSRDNRGIELTRRQVIAKINGYFRVKIYSLGAQK